ncbi:unnamed protein product [Lathyrus oleraceus]
MCWNLECVFELMLHRVSIVTLCFILQSCFSDYALHLPFHALDLHFVVLALHLGWLLRFGCNVALVCLAFSSVVLCLLPFGFWFAVCTLLRFVLRFATPLALCCVSVLHYAVLVFRSAMR